jgi:cyclophilin family peptidyl-prolyl cis-trans isomerase
MLIPSGEGGFMRSWLGVLMALWLAANLAAQEAAPPPAEEFSQVFARWKAVLAELRELQEKYPLASDAEKPGVEARFNELVAEGKKMAPALVAAAEKEFVSAPNKNEDVNRFLLNHAAELYAQGKFADSARLCKTLLEHKFDDQRILLVAGMADFGLNDFAAAQKHLQDAKAAKRLDAEGQLYLAEAQLRAAEAQADDLPRVKLATSKGDIVVELFENEAPNTVANFISLVEKKFYDGLLFHRVLEGFMAQGGDPQGNGRGGPGYRIDCECVLDNHRRHFPGTLSMAHAGPNTGGSQFFLTFVRTAQLDGKHTAFGRVVEGFDVLAKIQRFDPDNPPPTGKPTLDRIVTATVVRKRDHAYSPKTRPE